ncbi:hotdog domain-containing protein [Microbacterium sp. A93]|uniref:hotdog domain-containing protein n=1 Tax=Microbacterium sp. A93 TaxID=3450716 RepID=UPI003F41FF91
MAAVLNKEALENGPLVIQRRYVPDSHAHYAGGITAGAYAMELFGDAATELSVLHDGNEGLFAGYDAVTFLQPILVGDIVECRAALLSTGTRSRRMGFEVWVQSRRRTGSTDGTALVLDEPILATTAIGTVVAPEKSN